MRAAQVVAISFAAVILCGALLLMLPIASVSGQSCGPMTALFTATSATCVTGLILVDTLSAWTLFGQVVILAMIQLGGLGFMTVIFLMAMRVKRKLSLSQRLMAVSNFNLNDMGDVARLVRGALKTTFAFEGAGALILTVCFWPRFGAQALWKGLFTSISAFCNAGFDIFGTEKIGSLSTYDDNPVVLLTVAALIVCGGLGFFVWEEIKRRRRWKFLSLYSKMVLLLTGFLLAFGAAFFLLSEYDNGGTMASMPFGQSLLNALFQSATLRTAGFYSISQGALTDVSLVMCILLMLTGGSSGSCAGGLKTGTVGVLLLSLRSGLRGQGTVSVRGRTIPQQKVLSAVTLLLVVGILFLAASISIAVLDGVPYLAAAYETASAMATVGVTTGITPGLGSASHIILILLMYLGRVGFVSFSLAFLAQNPAKSKICYPETDVMIG
ncbi:MAG TPA: potassium uptake protein, TrkH family [Candidatus Enterenecus merdae]|nr:potassium uptake protein, TrkH family [Candidatus Enterenecus merdae]